MNVRYDMHEFSGDITGLSSLMMLESIKQSGVKLQVLSVLLVRDIRLDAPSPERAFPVPSPQPLCMREAHVPPLGGELQGGARPVRGERDSFQSRIAEEGERYSFRGRLRAPSRRIRACEEKIPHRRGPQAREGLGVCARVHGDDVEDYRQRCALRLRYRHGESHTVGEFVEEAFSYAGLDWGEHVKIDPRYFRPTGVEGAEGRLYEGEERAGMGAAHQVQGAREHHGGRRYEGARARASGRRGQGAQGEVPAEMVEDGVSRRHTVKLLLFWISLIRPTASGCIAICGK